MQEGQMAKQMIRRKIKNDNVDFPNLFFKQQDHSTNSILKSRLSVQKIIGLLNASLKNPICYTFTCYSFFDSNFLKFA